MNDAKKLYLDFIRTANVGNDGGSQINYHCRNAVEFDDLLRRYEYKGYKIFRHYMDNGDEPWAEIVTHLGNVTMFLPNDHPHSRRYRY